MDCKRFKKTGGGKGRPPHDSTCSDCGVVKRDHPSAPRVAKAGKPRETAAATVTVSSDTTESASSDDSEGDSSSEEAVLEFPTSDDLRRHLIKTGPRELSQEMKRYVDAMDAQEATAPGSSWNS